MRTAKVPVSIESNLLKKIDQDCLAEEYEKQDKREEQNFAGFGSASDVCGSQEY